MWLRRFDIRAPAPPQTWHLLGLEKAAQVAVSQEAADGAQGRVEGKPLPGLAPRLILALARMHCSGPTALRLESRFGAAGVADAASPSCRPVLTACLSPPSLLPAGTLLAAGPTINGRAVAQVSEIPPRRRSDAIAALHGAYRLRGEAPLLLEAEDVRAALCELGATDCWSDG